MTCLPFAPFFRVFLCTGFALFLSGRLSAQPIPQSITINGPSSLARGAAGLYLANVTYSDASMRSVTALWTSSAGATDFTAAFRLIGPGEASASGVDLHVSYTEAGTTVEDTLAVQFVAGDVTGPAALGRVRRATDERPESVVAQGVDLATGGQWLELATLRQGGGQPFAVNLRHNSLVPGERGSFGYGWRQDFEVSLAGNPDNELTVTWSDHRQSGFRLLHEGAAVRRYLPVDPADRRRQLIRTADAQAFELTSGDGTVHVFSAATRRLTAVRNKNGHTLAAVDRTALPARIDRVRAELSLKTLFFRYTTGAALVDYMYTAVGPGQQQRFVDFTYDAAGHLTRLTQPFAMDPGTYSMGAATIEPPDNDPQGVTININVTRTTPIGLVRLVAGDMPAESYPEVVITLRSPAGTVATVVDRLSRPVENFPLLSGYVSFLADFFGENPAGTWQLKIADVRAGGFVEVSGLAFQFTSEMNATDFTYDGEHRITQVTDALGRIMATTYDAEGRVATQDDGVETNEPETFAYQELPDGILRTTRTDRTGRTWQYRHDARYHLLELADPLAATTRFTYDSAGNRTTVTDPLGRTTILDYDAADNLASIVDPVGSTTLFEYDSRRNVTLVHDGRGHETIIAYDAKNNPITVTDASGNVYRKTYDTYSQITQATRPGGGEVEFSYDSQWNLTKVTHPVSAAEAMTMAYDWFGNLVTLTDPEDEVTRYEFNAADLPTKQTNPDGTVTSNRYDRRNRLIERIDESGRSTRRAYDANDNLIEVIDALGNVTAFTYEGEDRLATKTDALGHVTNYEYDAAGRPTRTLDPLGHGWRIEYDAAGNVAAQYDSTGTRVLGMDYTDRNEPRTLTDAYGHTVTLAYDETGNQTRITDALDRPVVRTFDPQDRLTTVTDPLNRIGRKHYDVDGILERMDTPGGSPRLFYHDPAGRLTEVWYGAEAENPRIISYEYNDWRDLLTDVWEPGARFRYAYDARGRRISKAVEVSGTPVVNVAYTYDSTGNLTRTREASHAAPIEREFDGLRRVTRFVDEAGGEILYEYDAVGNLARLTYPGGQSVHYTHDAARRLTRVVDWAGRITQLAYDENDRITRIDFPNGTYRTMAYDRMQRVRQRTDRAPDHSIIVAFEYDYDAAGQLANVQQTGGTSSYVPPPTTLTFNPRNYALTFNGQALQPDKFGSATVLPAGSSSYSTLEPAVQTIAAEYDVRQRLVRAGESSFRYDAEDRLTGCSDTGDTWSYTVDPHTGPSRVLVRQALNQTPTLYVYGVGLLYDVTGDQVQVYHYDEHGNTVALTNAAGAVVARYAYGPFGEEINPPAQPATPFRFQGLFGVLTDQSGLCFMQHRFYAPGLRRFINQDSYPGQIDDINSLNLFSYAHNNPFAYQDPDGEFVTILAGAIIGAAAGAGGELISSAIQGRRVDWKSVAAGAIGGAVEGAFYGSFVGAVAGGAAGGAARSFFDQGFHNGFDNVDYGEVGESAAWGAAFGFVGGAFSAGGGAIAQRFGRKSAQEFAENALRPTLRRILRDELKDVTVRLVTGTATKTVGNLFSDGYFDRFLNGASAGRLSFSTIGRDRYDPLRAFVARGLSERRGPYLHLNRFMNGLGMALVPVPNAANFGLSHL